MKKIFCILSVMACLIPTIVEAGGVSLRFALYMSPASISYQKIFLPFAENIKNDSRGRLRVELYPSGVLGRNPAEQIEIVRHGHADLAVVLPSLEADIFPGTEVAQIPGLIRNATEGSIAFWRTYASLSRLNPRGLKILSIFVTYPNTVHAVKPIDNVDSLKHFKLRVSTGPETKNRIGELAVPVQLPGGEVYTAMQRGFIDGAVMNWYLAERFRLVELNRYHYDLPLGSAMVALVMNENRYDQLSRSSRGAIDRNSGETLAIKWGLVWDKQNLAARHKIESAGGQITPLNQNDEAALHKKTDRWLRDLRGDASREVGARFVKELEAFRQKN